MCKSNPMQAESGKSFNDLNLKLFVEFAGNLNHASDSVKC